MNRSRVIQVAAFVLIGAIPLAYVAVRYGHRITALTPERTTAEYRTEAQSLTLAPGWNWPAAPIPSQHPDGSAVMFQKGFGKQAADFYWFCSWTSRAIDSQLPTSEGQQALQNLLSIRTKYWYTNALASVSKPTFDKALQAAAGGNMDDVRQFYELNCPKGPLS